MIRGIVEDLVIVAFIATATWGVTYYFMSKPVIEAPKPAVVQTDGSVVIERKAPDFPAKPKQKIPKGAKVERVSQVEVKPTKTDGSGLKIDMTLIREPDGGRRVIASSEDGQITGGFDVPVETPQQIAPHPWAAGLSFDPIHQTPGIWASRDLSRFRVGVEANKVEIKSGGVGYEARLFLGITF